MSIEGKLFPKSSDLKREVSFLISCGLKHLDVTGLTDMKHDLIIMVRKESEMFVRVQLRMVAHAMILMIFKLS